MKRSTLSAAAAVAASLVLALSACSSGGDDDGSDEIEGAGGGSDKPSASASTSEPPSKAGRPEVKLPSDFTMQFEGWKNSDPELQAILDDGREHVRADHAAVIDADADAKYLHFYNEGESLVSSQTWVKQYIKANVTLVGEITVSEPQAKVVKKDTGVLTYCLDEGKAFAKNRKTGKQTGTPEGDSPRLQYRTTLVKSPEGVWRTTTADTKRGGC
ncbi:hypothetical protein HUT18_21690 [Streptomyces sp. NA04227]|uniref:hypothetical protein n=1 Tax=Streptomyces sp. NA04227 TaxID=2742136 RepID=UPI0015911C34|nr:hypothetical protein [Streptomyces sp. NA04227]QKW08591.1 hypothetical protein HUT18_21690 [Streptomyces sp. NA04227]